MRNFSFNGITKDYISVLKGSNRLPWAPVERGYQELPNRPGALLNSIKTKPRTLDIPVLLKAENTRDLQKLKEDFAEWLIHDDPKPLVFDDEPDRIYHAIADGSIDLNELVKFGEGVIHFVCPDPYKYGIKKTILLGDDPVKNEGSVESYPDFTTTFSAEASEFKILHTQKNEYVRVIRNFKPGDVLEIFFGSGKISLNGEISMQMLDWVGSEFFTLSPGIQSLAISPLGVAETYISWEPRWL